jgi:hypothetical protein
VTDRGLTIGEQAEDGTERQSHALVELCRSPPELAAVDDDEATAEVDVTVAFLVVVAAPADDEALPPLLRASWIR